MDNTCITKYNMYIIHRHNKRQQTTMHINIIAKRDARFVCWWEIVQHVATSLAL